MTRTISLISPANNSGNNAQNLTFDWNVTTEPPVVRTVSIQAESCIIAWQPDSYAESYKIYKDSIFVESVGKEVAEYTFISLLPDTSYAFGVSAIDKLGNESTISTLPVFTTITTEILGLEVSDITTASVTLSWRNNPYFNNGYRIWGHNMSSPTYQNFEITVSAGSTSGTIDTTLLAQPLTSGDEYIFNVAGIRDGVEQEASILISATRLAAIGTPWIGSQSSTIPARTSDLLRFVFSAVGGVDSYRIYDDTGAIDITIPQVTSFPQNVYAGPAENLMPGTVYNLNFVGYKHGLESTPSLFQEYTLLTAVQNFIRGEITDTSVELLWDEKPNIDEYRLIEANSPLDITLPIGTTSYIHTGLSNSNYYHYTLLAYKDGIESESVTIETFLAASAPSNFVSVATTTTTNTFTWNHNSIGLGTFVITANEGAYEYGPFLGTQYPVGATYGRAVTVTGLEPETIYDFQIYEYTPPVNSMKSPIVTVTTPAVPPELITDFAVTATTTSSIDVSWTESSNAESYRVWAVVYTLPTPSTTILFDETYLAGTNSATITLPPELAGEIFTCHITSFKSELTSAVTEIHVCTRCEAPTGLALGSQSINGSMVNATLVWNPPADGWLLTESDNWHSVTENYDQGRGQTASMSIYKPCGTEYEWEVYRYNSKDNFWSQSESTNITVTLAAALASIPINLVQTDATGTTGTIAWDAPADGSAVSYKIALSDGYAQNTVFVGETANTTFTFDKIEGLDRAYVYSMNIEDVISVSNASVMIQFPPAAPTLIGQYSSIQTSGIRIQWNTTGMGTNDTVLYTVTNVDTLAEKTGSLLASVGNGQIDCTDIMDDYNTSPGAAFTVTIRFQDYGNPFPSDPSNEITCYTGPVDSQITQVGATATTMDITWIPTPGAASYGIYGLVNGVTYKSYTTSNQGSFTLTNLVPMEQYEIKVEPLTSVNGSSYYFAAGYPISAYSLMPRPYPITTFNAVANGNNVNLTWSYSYSSNMYLIGYQITCVETGLTQIISKTTFAYTNVDAFVGKTPGEMLTYNIIVVSMWDYPVGTKNEFGNSTPTMTTVQVP